MIKTLSLYEKKTKKCKRVSFIVVFVYGRAHVYVVSVFVFSCVCVCKKRDWLRRRVCLVLPEWVRSDKADSHRLIFLRAASLSPSHRMADTQTPTERK